MASSHSSAHSDHAHPAGPHPELPEVTDESADSPMWLPATGLVLFLILAFVGIASKQPSAEEIEMQAAAEQAAAEEAPAEAAAPAQAAAPVRQVPAH